MMLVLTFLEAMRRRLYSQKTLAPIEYKGGDLFENICNGLNMLWSQRGVDPSSFFTR